ncbi:hypothetical protein A3C86_04365 [Candidatus Kaiserbacteria bacterium RIFCSPHIGHO2_02_FULL_49_16]|uniref:Methyltransferase type 11 domain-containing protein n=1 Tax=Candidatus Kaiserbacteria bacterium RIFCSPHIGHO2_02_FULL_49_16 TaxID=1798490 RepID=A0A1F6D9H6_9BACT|nr:MAG: hypothetical protein A3C86_04365 [Candidatus Kaiserbacteria bacterium RIFCSPHIGHO2_02_FULL_49_16]
MRERIVIRSPEQNTDSRRDNLAHAPEVQQLIIEEMARLGITPQKYPRAIDLAAGNGSFATEILLPQKWQARDITNVDIAIPNPDISPGTRWLYLNLEQLGHTLSSRGELPREILSEQGNHDFGSEESGFDIHQHIDYLADFFLRKGGVFWTVSGRHRLLRPRIGRWRQTGPFFFEKE